MFSLKTPAKINWALYVLDRRADGFHNIVSLTHCVNLYDRISFDHSDALEIFSNLQIPTEEDLVYKAARALQAYSETNRGARIMVHKEIPSGAGLGGGSSDAACTLVGLNRLWRLDLGIEELSQIGQRIGSDVPLFLRAPLCLVGGRGDIVTSLEMTTSYFLLLVKPDWSVATGWAYAEIDRARHGQAADSLTKKDDKNNNISLLYRSLRLRDTASLLSLCHNDFEDVVAGHHNELRDIKAALLSQGATLALMTGSGSAVFGVFESRGEAEVAADAFKPLWTRVVETLR